jgi:hypothetical protein
VNDKDSFLINFSDIVSNPFTMSNTTPKRGRSDIYFHRKDAKHAEDLFYFFCFPLRGRKAKRSNPSGF